MGKERATIFGNDSTRYDFEPLPQMFTDVLTEYCHKGGNLLISGANIGQDAFEGELASESAQDFVNNVLFCDWVSARNAHDNATVSSIIPQYDNITASWNSRPNSHCYAVEQTDIFVPFDDNATTFMEYSDGSSAAIAAKTEQYRCCTLGFPLETIESNEKQYEILKLIFNFFKP